MATRVARRPPPPIIHLRDFDESTNLLIYGDSGAGKTVLSGTMPNGLFLQCDPGGTISAKRFDSTADLIICTSWEELDEAVMWLREGGHKKYEWVCLDSITFAQELLWDFIMRRVVEKNAARNRFVPDKGEYYNNFLAIKHLAVTLVNLPCNTITTAHPWQVMRRNGDEVIMAGITGQDGLIAEYIMGLQSAYGFMKPVKVRRDGELIRVRRIYWEQKDMYLGKDRYGVLNPHTDDITIPEIQARILATGKKLDGTPRPKAVARPTGRPIARPNRRSR